MRKARDYRTMFVGKIRKINLTYEEIGCFLVGCCGGDIEKKTARNLVGKLRTEQLTELVDILDEIALDPDIFCKLKARELMNEISKCKTSEPTDRIQ